MPSSPRLPLGGPQLLFYKLRAGGFAWLRERLVEECRLPRTGPGQALHRVLRALVLTGRRYAPHPRADDDVLYALYDLAVAPITYDFLWFLVGAELERRRRGVAGVHVTIVPGVRAGLRKEPPELEAALDPATRRARVIGLLVPACACLPSLTGIAIAGSREEAERRVAAAGERIFPARYEPALPRYPGPQEPLRAAREDGAQVAALRAPETDLANIDQWLAAENRDRRRRVVTITLRGYGYTPERNSNIADWAAFARGCDPALYSVVIVPDTAQCFAGIPEELARFPICREAALMPGLRMALYERAWLNLGVNNGPMGLCWLNSCTRYITFKIVNDAAPHTSAEYMEFLGFELGRSLPFATPFQQWVWADDDLATIESAFHEMVARIEHASPAEPHHGVVAERTA